MAFKVTFTDGDGVPIEGLDASDVEIRITLGARPLVVGPPNPPGEIMSKFVFGPGSDHVEPHADLATLGVRPLALRGLRRGGLVDLTIGPADASTSDPIAVHAAYLDKPPAVDADPKATLDGAAVKGQLDAAALAAGGDVTITVSPAPTSLTRYWVQTILEIPDAV